MLATVAVICTSCGGPTSPRDGRMSVVAAENFWGDIAAQLGGSHVRVRSLISSPDADPHLFESDASDAAAVGRAAVVIENGAGYDAFMSHLLAPGGVSGRAVVSVQDSLGATGTDVNPHFWYDIPRIPTVAAAIDAALIRKDPAHAADYRANLTRFDASLAPLTDAVAGLRAAFPGAPVAYTERVPAYLLAAAGLRVLTPPGFARAVEDGNDPSPADAAAMDALLSGRKVRVLLYNLQTATATTAHARQLAVASGVPVVGVTETMPAGAADYQQWQLGQLRALAAALARSR